MVDLDHTRNLLEETERVLAMTHRAVQEMPEYRDSMADNIRSLAKMRDQLRADLSASGVIIPPLSNSDAAAPATAN
jgi:hypothetical protein